MISRASILLALLLAAPLRACACRCRPAPFAQYYSDAQIVFIGKAKKVIPARGMDEQDQVFFERIGSIIKGAGADTSRFFTAQSSAACGVHFEIDKTYLLFGKPSSKKKGSYILDTCSGTRVFNPNSPASHSDFIDLPATQILRALSNLRTAASVQRTGIGGVAKEQSIIGLLSFTDPFTPIIAREQPSEDSPQIRMLQSLADTAVREISYERKGVVVVAKDNAWFRLQLIDGSHAWINTSDINTSFVPLSNLLIRRAGYLTDAWDGLLWPDPGAGNPIRIDASTLNTKAILVEEVAEVADSLWFRIKLHKTDPCESGTSSFRAHGWIPAWNPAGEITSWYWSRGC